MKLADKYRPTSDFQLPQNAFYQYFGEKLSRVVFATTPDSASQRVKFEENGRMLYHQTNEEQEFYNEKYISISTLESKMLDKSIAPHTNDYSIPEELCKVNEVERYILDFIYNGGHRLVVTGKKGWGKTTLMRYIALHILPILNKYDDNKPCTPLYISFDSRLNDFEKASSLSDYEEIFYNELLLNEIREYCMDRIGEDLTSDFYQYLLNRSIFSKEKMCYNDIKKEASRGWITSDERDKAFHELRKKIAEKKETILLSFAYFNEDKKCSSIPIIFLDDLDPLDIDVQSYIYNEIYKLAHEYQIKVVVAMRPRSYERVYQNTTDALQARTFSLTFPELKSYLQHKVNLILQKTDKDVSGIPINNAIIRPVDIPTFFHNYTQALLQKDSISFLVRLSDGNLRTFNDLIHTYLSSGYVSSEDILKKLIQIRDSSTSQPLPMWIIYSSIIANNHRTVFGRSYDEPKNFVVNILCNGREGINIHLIRLHLLSLFMRTNHAPLTISTIIDKYKKLAPCSNEWNTDSCEWSVVRAVKRFANARLLGNNNRTKIPDKRLDSIEKNDEFYLEELGRYYYTEMIKIFEYFAFMKDDMDFGDNKFEIKDCIEVHRHIDRFAEVIKYLQYLFFTEVDFCKKLTEDQLKYYLEIFAPINSSKLFYTKLFVDNMLGYAETRKSILENRIKVAIENEADISIIEIDLEKLNRLVLQLNKIQEEVGKEEFAQLQRIA